MHTVIWTATFLTQAKRHRLSEEEMESIVNRLADDPLSGDIMPGTGGARKLGARFYFATPYHSWERGLNGHSNGLVRQYLPKGMGLRAVGDDGVKAVQDRLNARPRRVLGYRTPAEVFRRARPP